MYAAVRFNGQFPGKSNKSTVRLFMIAIGLLGFCSFSRASTPSTQVASDLHVGSQCSIDAQQHVTIDGDIPLRQIRGQGGSITVYFDPQYLKDAKIDEVERQTLLESQLGTLLKSLVAAGGPPTCDDYKRTKPLKYKRGTVTISAIGNDGNVSGTATITTGPDEHAFLGLDLPVSNRKTLKYDSASNSLQPASSSPQLYLSLNFLYGDILSPAKDYGIDNLSLKIFISANSTPLNSYGAGLGYRLPDLKIGTFSMSSLSIYGGYFLTKQDALSGGATKVNGSTDHGWRFGVTYDLSTALKWVKW